MLFFSLCDGCFSFLLLPSYLYNTTQYRCVFFSQVPDRIAICSVRYLHVLNLYTLNWLYALLLYIFVYSIAFIFNTIMHIFTTIKRRRRTKNASPLVRAYRCIRCRQQQFNIFTNNKYKEAFATPEQFLAINVTKDPSYSIHHPKNHAEVAVVVVATVATVATHNFILCTSICSLFFDAYFFLFLFFFIFSCIFVWIPHFFVSFILPHATLFYV